MNIKKVPPSKTVPMLSINLKNITINDEFLQEGCLI